MTDRDNGERSVRTVLGPRQRATVAAALTVLGVAVIVAAVSGVGWLLAMFLRTFVHVFLPLAIGAVAALIFAPYYHWLERKLRLPGPVAVGVVFASILVPLVAFGWFFGAVAVEQIRDMAERFPAWWKDVSDSWQERWPEVKHFIEENPWAQRVREAISGQGSAALAALGSIGGRAISAGKDVVGAFGALAAWVVLPVYFAYFLMAGAKVPDDVEKLLPFLKTETRKDVGYLVREFVAILVAFFRGQLLVALAQGILFAIGFSAVGLRYGFVLGIMLGFLNVIPYLGSIIGLGICLPLAWFQEGGGPLLFGLVIVVFTLVQTIEGYLLTPKIMGDRTGLHPVAIIVALFFWGSALQGILGMILAIPLTAFLVVFWRLAREKYISEWV